MVCLWTYVWLAVLYRTFIEKRFDLKCARVTCFLALQPVHLCKHLLSKRVWIVELGHVAAWFAWGLVTIVALYLSLCFLLRSSSIQHGVVTLRKYFSYASACLLCSYCVVVIAFLQDDFSTRLVWENSYSTTPWWYKWTAVWGNHDGSWLLWCLLTAMQLSVALFGEKNRPHLRVMLLFSSVFMSFILSYQLFFANPFLRLLPMPPPQGMDLNPLLQDTMFLTHPPLLYAGSTALSVVYIYSLCACWSQDFFDNYPWQESIRLWSLWSWTFLTAGIALGSYWAYHELGWGGWWFWDPVENLSLLPWLITTAVLHTRFREVSSQEKKNTLAMALSACTVVVLGLFVVRSGLLVSVHSFADNPRKATFLLAFFLVIAACSLLSWFRLRYMLSVQRHVLVSASSLVAKSSTNAIDWLAIQRTMFYLLHLWLLLATLYPWVSEVFLDQKVSVGHDYFHTFVGAIWLMMGFAMGLSQMGKNIKKALKLSVVSAFVTLSIMLFVYMQSLPWDLIYCGVMYVTVWVFATHFSRIQKSYRARRIGALVHVCVAFFACAVTLQSYRQSYTHATLKPGQHLYLGQTRLAFHGVKIAKGPNYDAKVASITVSLNDGQSVLLHPEIRYFKSRQMATTKSAVHSAWFGDHYFVVTEPSPAHYQLRWYSKPYQRLVWLSLAGLVLLGWMLWLQAYRQRRGVVSVFASGFTASASIHTSTCS